MTDQQTTSFPPWPHFEEDEIEAAVRVLRSGKVNYWTGTEGREFEKEFASYCNRKYGIALMNGTVALELCLHVLGIGEGDEVIVPPRTFIASASCVALRGAKPVFVDVDRDSQNIDPGKIEAAITSRTKAIIVVHLNGWPCDMDPILEIANKHNLKVIEDCAQALGARYKGKPVGSFGHMAAFSFCQDKIMTTGGEGGMIVTDDEVLWKAAWSYKDHGKDWDAVYNKEHPPGFRWLVESFGTNWRMGEMQAAIGRAQLGKVDAWVTKRRENAEVLMQTLSEARLLRVPLPTEEVHHAYYRVYAFVQPERLAPEWDRQRIASTIASKGIPCDAGICSEVYREEAFAGTEAAGSACPVARELGETSLFFLVHPTLSSAHMQQASAVLKETLESACQG